VLKNHETVQQATEYSATLNPDELQLALIVGHAGADVVLRNASRTLCKFLTGGKPLPPNELTQDALPVLASTCRLSR
jgi:hypothetical protein